MPKKIYAHPLCIGKDKEGYGYIYEPSEEEEVSYSLS